MAYSELIKSFDRIRSYMRDFYIYGFKRREEYAAKSPRSYDNERRRIESWLGDYMSFRQDASGKRVFISIDSRNIAHNPLYNAFKAKSFTDKDIMLHFFLLDILQDGQAYPVRALTDALTKHHLAALDDPPALDVSTVRNKLREYETLGLLTAEKRGNQLYYALQADTVPLEAWRDAIAFFSEENPLGVVGSFLLDRLPAAPTYFRFKHHFLLYALESEVICSLLEAISAQTIVEIDSFAPRRKGLSGQVLTPLRIYVSTQGGRSYLMAYAHDVRRIKLIRLDSIKSVKLLKADRAFDAHLQQADDFARHLWGVASSGTGTTERVELTIFAAPEEAHIVSRLEREKRCGTVEALGENLYRFTADVYDATELLPWLRTFIGRIRSLHCSNARTEETFLADLQEMTRMYLGGDADALP